MRRTHLEAIEGHEGGAPPLEPVQVIYQGRGNLIVLHDHVEQLIARSHLHCRIQRIYAFE